MGFLILLGIFFVLIIIGTIKIEVEKQQANRAMIEMNKRDKARKEKEDQE